MINRKNKYSKHVLLNGDNTSFMGSLKMFYGKAYWNSGGKRKNEILFALSDCHNVARIHPKNDSKEEIKKFIKKIRKIAKGANEFANYLDETVKV